MGDTDLTDEIDDLINKIREFKFEVNTYIDEPQKIVEVAKEEREDGYKFVKFSKNPVKWEDEDRYYIFKKIVEGIENEIDLRGLISEFMNQMELILEELNDEKDEFIRYELTFLDDLLEAIEFEEESNLQDLLFNIEDTEGILVDLKEILLPSPRSRENK